MNARYLIATLSLMLAAGATFAALKHGPVDAPKAMTAAECADVAQATIPRVVITARRDQAQGAGAPVARVVVTARRSEAGSLVATASN